MRFSVPTEQRREFGLVSSLSLVLLLLMFLRTERITYEHPHFVLPYDW